MNRLNQTLGNYASAIEINNDVLSLSGVPGLWGPTTAEITVWS